MAANQTINNNSIRTILIKEKLNGSKFLDWYRSLRLSSRMNKSCTTWKRPYLKRLMPLKLLLFATPTLAEQELFETVKTFHACKQEEGQSVSTYVLNMKAYLDQIKVAKQQEVACIMLAEQELFETVKTFHACKQEEGQSVSTYVLNMKDYLDQIEYLGYPMPLVLRVNLLKDYDQFVQNYNMYDVGKTIPELHAMLKLTEKGIPKKAPAVLAIRQGQIQKPKPQARGNEKNKGKGKSKLAYDPRHKIHRPTKKEHPAKDTKCHHCHKTGHWRRKCPFYLAELKKNKASTSGTPGGLRGIQKLNKGALDLYVGNGNHVAVKAIGSFDLIIPSGMVLVLDNYYALWEVIVNGDAPAVASASTEGPIPPKTAKQKIARKNELKAKSTMLLTIPDEHLLKFHGIKDAKSLWEAIKTRFRGNKESKIIQKTILKSNMIIYYIKI
ncbi:zinc finger, CCHC-type containing protein [Tanacetum coccineum]